MLIDQQAVVETTRRRMRASEPVARGGRLSFGDALHLLKNRQKPGPGVPAYTRWVNRGLARYVAAGTYRLGVSPNGVTAISAAVSVAGLAVLLLVPRSVWVGLLVGVLLAAGYLLDSADGQVARLSGRSSRAGEWLDHVVDAIRMPAFHLSTLVALYLSDVDSWVLVLPLLYALVTTGQFFSQILAEQLAEAGSKPTPRRGQSLFLLPIDTGVLCWIFILWGLPTMFIAAYGLLLVLNFAHSAVSMRRRFRQLNVPTAGRP